MTTRSQHRSARQPSPLQRLLRSRHAPIRLEPILDDGAAPGGPACPAFKRQAG